MDVTSRGLAFIKSIEEFCGKKSKWLVKDEEKTSPEYGVVPWDRSIKDYVKNGIINLDKPPGPTSHEVVAWIKKMFGLTRAGHGGTLEPLR